MRKNFILIFVISIFVITLFNVNASIEISRPELVELANKEIIESGIIEWDILGYTI